MHELSVTQSILTLALEEAAKIGAARITGISIKAGEWSTYEPECLRFCFGILAQGTPAEGAILAIEAVPVTYACANCGGEYHPEGGRTCCPSCSSARRRLIRGRELSVDSIEVQNANTSREESTGGK